MSYTKSAGCAKSPSGKSGEGTGKPIDLDRFDDHYWHLFVWNRQRSEVAGAYRLGPSDEILARFGPKGFYTSQLFQWKRSFLDRISPALELGRSFVRPEYQKTYAPLLLLWKGIGQFLIRNPQYKLLFGPVSISNGYTAASRHLMVKFLSAYRQSPELAPLVRARNPFRQRASKQSAKLADELIGATVWDVEELSALIADVEIDRKGVPVLLKQYLKLGGELVAFHVDRRFADALDGLIVVDLRKTDARVLERYMGKEGAAQFLKPDNYYSRFAAEEEETCVYASLQWPWRFVLTAWNASAQSDPDQTPKTGSENYFLRTFQLSGSIRERWEATDGPFSVTPASSYVVSQIKLGLLYKPSSWLHFFAQAQDVRVLFYQTTPSNAFSDPFDLHQAWVTMGQPEGPGFFVQIGRQDMVIGSGHLLASTDDWWVYTARNFDVANGSYTTKYFKAQLVAGSVILVNPVSPNEHRPGDHVYADYNTFPHLLPGASLEPSLMRQNLRQRDQQGRANWEYGHPRRGRAHCRQAAGPRGLQLRTVA